MNRACPEQTGMRGISHNEKLLTPHSYPNYRAKFDDFLSEDMWASRADSYQYGINYDL